jgi:queuine tRNA-ribosyltransferase
MQIQNSLNSDVVMIFDECTPYKVGEKIVNELDANKSMQLSLRWAQRSRDEFQRLENTNAQFGIVQGGMFEKLREDSAAKLIDMNFEGYAIGGLSVGEPKEDMLRVLRHTAPLLPPAKARYLMGVGTPEDLVEGVAAGVDMFDCVLPSRNARNGWLFTRFGDLRLRNTRYKTDMRPIDGHCQCYACKNFSRGYVHHLQKVDEILGARLATIHNLHYFLELMSDMRLAIEAKQFSNFQVKFHADRARGVDD